MNDFLKKIIGEIEDKKEWKSTQRRAEALPEEYRVVYDEIQKYILEGGAGVVSTINPFKRLVDMLEEGAATGKHVLEITGDDVAAFANKIVREEEPDAEDWRDKLNREIEKEMEDRQEKLNNNIAKKFTK